MEKEVKACPNCGADLFYVDDPSGGLVFFKVDLAARPFAHKDPALDLSHLNFDIIHCAGCGWYGRLDELS